MQSTDILLHICSRMDDRSIYFLSRTCRKTYSLVDILVGLDQFWYLRVQHFLQAQVAQRREADWNVVYYCLLEGDRQNELVLLIELELDYPFPDHLRLAVEHGYVSLLEKLLADPRVDVTEGDNYAIKIACKLGHAEIVKLLLDDGRIDDLRMALCLAIEGYNSSCPGDQLGVMKLLLAHPRLDPRPDADYLMIAAVITHQLQAIKLLLEDKRFDPRANDNSPLLYCADNDCVAVMKLLLEDGRADPSVLNNYALRTAHKRGCREIVNLLIADTRIDSLTRLRYNQVAIGLLEIAIGIVLVFFWYYCS